MNSDTIIILVFGFIILLLLIGLFFINRLISYKKKVENSFAIVNDIFKSNSKLIDEITSWIKNNLEHEEEFIKKLNEAKMIIQDTNLHNINFSQIEKALKIILKFTNLEEIYSFLKKDKQYLKSKKGLLDNQNRFSYAMDGYNKEVECYDNYRNQKFMKILNKLLRFPKYDYYNK